MMSKNLYWAKWKENIKRRGWSLVICFVALFLFFPVRNIIALNSGLKSAEEVLQAGTAAEDMAKRLAWIQSDLAENIGISGEFTLCMALFAVIFAVQGFSFLYSRRKMDLYMSVPVSGPKRFVMIWANGMLMFVLCYLPNLILTWGIGAALGVMDSKILAGSVLAFFVNMLAFTAMYQLALLAVLLTGNVLTALLGCSVLFLYEWVVRVLFGELKSRFFVSYCRADQERLDALPWLTPFCGYLNLKDGAIWYAGGTAGRYGKYTSAYGEAGWYGMLFKEVLLLLLAAAALGALVYLVFRKRKTESYHHAIAFQGMKGVLEVFMLVPFSLVTAMLVCDMAQDENLFLAAGALGGLVIGHGIIQLIYERDLRAVVQKRGAFFVSLAAVALVLILFRFDLTGFDDYLPDSENIESVAVSMESDYGGFGWYDFEGNDFPGSAAERLLKRMDSGEKATVDAVLHMVQVWQDAGRPDRSDIYEARMNPADAETGPEREGEKAEELSWDRENSSWFVVRYKLTDGRSVYRRFLVDASLCREALNTVMNDASYQKNRYQIYTEEFEKAVDSMKIVYFDGKQDLLYTTDKKQLLEALRNDFKGYDFDLISEQRPRGVLRFLVLDSDSYGGYDFSYPVYESFASTIEALEQNGIDAGIHRGILDAEDVREITVRYYVYDDWENWDDEIFETGEVPGQTVVCSFSGKEEIGEILDSLYPTQLQNAVGEEMQQVQGEWSYRVEVSLTEEAMKKGYIADDLFFLEGRVPEFVKKKIKESAVRG